MVDAAAPGRPDSTAPVPPPETQPPSPDVPDHKTAVHRGLRHGQSPSGPGGQPCDRLPTIQATDSPASAGPGRHGKGAGEGLPNPRGQPDSPVWQRQEFCRAGPQATIRAPVPGHPDHAVRIRRQMFLCMLAYYVQRHAQQRLKPLFANVNDVDATPVVFRCQGPGPSFRIGEDGSAVSCMTTGCWQWELREADGGRARACFSTNSDATPFGSWDRSRAGIWIAQRNAQAIALSTRAFARSLPSAVRR
jgi:hypothetical protein